MMSQKELDMMIQIGSEKMTLIVNGESNGCSCSQIKS